MYKYLAGFLKTRTAKAKQISSVHHCLFFFSLKVANLKTECNHCFFSLLSPLSRRPLFFHYYFSTRHCAFYTTVYLSMFHPGNFIVGQPVIRREKFTVANPRFRPRYCYCCGSIFSLVYFPLFWGMVIYDNEFETKENKVKTNDKIEPQHYHRLPRDVISPSPCSRIRLNPL